MSFTERTDCRSCESTSLSPILSLGEHYLPGWTQEPSVGAPKVPLDLLMCTDCSLLQLRHSTRPNLLWNENYGYKSGINQTMRAHLEGITQETSRRAALGAGDIVIDIGCNDGTLLNSYAQPVYRVGFDPSWNVLSEAFTRLGKNARADYKLFNDFFDAKPYLNYFPRHSAKAVTAISMFYDLEDPNHFLQGVKEVLSPEGVLVVQQNYLGGMLSQTAFDNICHEHLEYYSLKSMETLLERHDMEVFDVELNELNGGSFRTYIQNRGGGRRTLASSIAKAKLQQDERRRGLDTPTPYRQFARRTREAMTHLADFVQSEHDKGKSFYAYGASTRGSTLLQAAGLDHTLITGAAERNPDKYGKFTNGTNIPIVSEAEARTARPDYFLVLPWFFKNEFVQREQEYLDSGGKLVFPLPKFEVIDR